MKLLRPPPKYAQVTESSAYVTDAWNKWFFEATEKLKNDQRTRPIPFTWTGATVGITGPINANINPAWTARINFSLDVPCFCFLRSTWGQSYSSTAPAGWSISVGIDGSNTGSGASGTPWQNTMCFDYGGYPNNIYSPGTHYATAAWCSDPNATLNQVSLLLTIIPANTDTITTTTWNSAGFTVTVT